MNCRVIESALARASLKRITEVPDIQKILFAIAKRLREQVFLPFYANTIVKQQFTELSLTEQQVVHTLALKHCQSDKKLGALFPELHYETLKNHHWHELLQKIDSVLSSHQPLSTMEEVLTYLKVLDDMGHTYCSGSVPIKEKETYKLLKNLVYPTFEEIDMRRAREEKMLAMTYGIGIQVGADLFNEAEVKSEGWLSGKAKFHLPDLAERLRVLLEEFNKKNISEELKVKLDAASKEERKSLLESLSVDLRSMIKTLQYYKIPLTKKAFTSVEFATLKKHKNSFEKLIVIERKNGKESLPLVASPSNSTSRLFIAAYCTGALNQTDGSFDFTQAQIFANTLMAYFVHCGHHSFSEVAYIYDEMLEFIALYHPEQLPKGLIPEFPSAVPYIDAPDQVERRLPVWRVGDYASFLNPVFRSKEINDIPLLSPRP